MSEAETGIGDRDAGRESSSVRQLFRRLWHSRLAVTGAMLLFLVLVAALFADLLAHYDPLSMTVADRMQPPSLRHLMGTDNFRRDIFSRVLHGARLSMEVGAAVMLLTVATGVLFGLLSGYFSRLDGPNMRVMHAMMAFPALLFGIAVILLDASRCDAVFR